MLTEASADCARVDPNLRAAAATFEEPLTTPEGSQTAPEGSQTAPRILSPGANTIAGMVDQPSLTGHVALVAGGTRGAGRGISVELGAAGATVYVSGRSTRAARSD